GQVQRPQRNVQRRKPGGQQVEIAVHAVAEDLLPEIVRQLVRRVEGEVAVTGVVLPAIPVVEDEEAVPLDGQVGGTVGSIDASLAEVGGDRGNLASQADLARVRSAVVPAGRRSETQRVR